MKNVISKKKEYKYKKTYEQAKNEMIYKSLLSLCMELTSRINSNYHFAKVPLKMELISLPDNLQESLDKVLRKE